MFGTAFSNVSCLLFPSYSICIILMAPERITGVEYLPHFLKPVFQYIYVYYQKFPLVV